MSWLLVALGAGLGSGVRFVIATRLDHRWPTGTFAVNLAGSFLLGLFSGWALTGNTLAFLGTGLCGGLTTFSALMVQSTQRGPRLGSAYLLATVSLAIAACALGFATTA